MADQYLRELEIKARDGTVGAALKLAAEYGRLGMQDEQEVWGIRAAMRGFIGNNECLYDFVAGGNKIMIRRGNTSIVSRSGSYGWEKGKYEILPSVGGIGIEELFGAADDVIGWKELKDALEIAEAAAQAESGDLKGLKKLYELVK